MIRAIPEFPTHVPINIAGIGRSEINQETAGNGITSSLNSLCSGDTHQLPLIQALKVLTIKIIMKSSLLLLVVLAAFTNAAAIDLLSAVWSYGSCLPGMLRLCRSLGGAFDV